jgi:hypothetical protein
MFRERAEKSPTWWLCCEAAANASLEPNSLITGKIQGIFADLGSDPGLVLRFQIYKSVAYGQIPYA